VGLGALAQAEGIGWEGRNQDSINLILKVYDI
jgi:hypothetical protein